MMSPNEPPEAAQPIRDCAWCKQPVRSDTPATKVAHGWLHDSPCLTEFNDWMATEEVEPEVLP